MNLPGQRHEDYTPEGGPRGPSRREFDDEKVNAVRRRHRIGIDPADQPYVFDRFFTRWTAPTAGWVAGWAVHRQELMKSMGEAMWLKSEVGAGSRFYFTLRRA